MHGVEFTDEAVDHLEYIHGFLIEAEVFNHQETAEEIISAAQPVVVSSDWRISIKPGNVRFNA